MAAPTRLIALLGALSIVFLASAASAFAASYANPTRIVIADNQPANPYPSAVAVSGLSGDITDVNVTLRGVSHTFLDDVGVVVESPTASMSRSVAPGGSRPGKGWRGSIRCRRSVRLW